MIQLFGLRLIAPINRDAGQTVKRGEIIAVMANYPGADVGVQMAENNLTSGADRSQVITAARQTIQFAEDARALSAERQEACLGKVQTRGRRSGRERVGPVRCGIR